VFWVTVTAPVLHIEAWAQSAPIRLIVFGAGITVTAPELLVDDCEQGEPTRLITAAPGVTVTAPVLLVLACEQFAPIRLMTLPANSDCPLAPIGSSAIDENPSIDQPNAVNPAGGDAGFGLSVKA
jgi:hypothetical protein